MGCSHLFMLSSLNLSDTSSLSSDVTGDGGFTITLITGGNASTGTVSCFAASALLSSAW